MKYTPYQQRIRDCFAAAYNFIDSHKQTRTDEDWEQVAKNLSPYTDPLAVDLVVACFNELERIFEQPTRRLNMINRGRFRYADSEIKAILKSAVVLTDTREQSNSHILTALDKLKVSHRLMALSSGDYSVMLPARTEAGINRDMYFDAEVIIERKADLDELAGNFTTGRERFKDEMIRAGTARKYLIVEQGGGYAAILNRQYRSRLSEKSFYASLLSFQARYGLNVIFCGQDMTAEIIWGLLYYHVRTWLMGEGELLC